MTTPPDINSLAASLRKIYAQSPGNAEGVLERFLEDQLGSLDPEARRGILKQLEDIFLLPSPEPSVQDSGSLISLLLGADVSSQDLNSPEIQRRLGESLNVIFSTLNDLVSLINYSLGASPAGDETIRHIIGSTLEGEGRMQSIEEYLSQIKKAFLIAQQASKEAAHTIAGYILAELDPKNLEASGKGFRIGPLKKAEAYDTFEEKYGRVMKWFQSERFLMDFLRQFEKNCQKSFT